VIFFTLSMPPLLALYAKQFLEIELYTFDYHENKAQRTIDSVPMFYYTKGSLFAGVLL